MTELEVLTNINRGVGVLIALAGTVVAAPDGALHALRFRGAWLRKRGGELRNLIAKVIPSLRHVPMPGRIANVTGATHMGVGAYARSRAWQPSAPVDERIEALRQQITEVEGHVNRLEQGLRQETDARKQAIVAVQQQLAAEVAQLKELLAARDQETAAVDARALPLIGVGVLVSGVPDFLATLPPWHLGWLVPAGAITYAVRVTCLVFGPRLRRAAVDAVPVSPAAAVDG